MARQVQERIQRELCLGASIGIGPNKFIAKMASGVNKPRGITCFSRLEFRRHFDALRVGELWGVGEATEKALNQLGIQTVQDLAGFPEGKLSATFGVVGPSLRLVAQGLDDSPVVPPEEGPDAKSIGHEHTLARDEYDPGRLASHMLRLSNQVARRARLQGFAGRVVTLKIRSPDFKTRSMQSKQTHWVSDGIEIHRISLALLARMERPPGVRLVGVSLGDLTRLEQDPQELLFQEERKVRDLTQAADRLRSRMGEDVLMRAGELLCWNG